MEITEARVKLMERPSERLKAFCSITFDNAFVIRDLKIIEGSKGIFVAMPSRKITDHCTKCGGKNFVQSKFCCECGAKLEPRLIGGQNIQERIKLYADIAHPINSQCREMIQQKVLQAYKNEVERAKQPGYKPAASIEEHPSDLQASIEEHPSDLQGKV